MNQSQSTGDAIPTGRRCLRFVLGSALIITVWCGVLPWIAAQPRMTQRLEFLDDRGIDPSAMFYTELDAMDAILGKLNEQ
jgi:hypothetical protein